MPRRSSLSWSVPLLLVLQLGMLWIQGAQIHQQNRILRELRGDIQDLTDSLNSSQDAPEDQDDSGVQPLRSHPHPARLQRASFRQQDGAGAASKEAARELEASRTSAQKAVQEAREDQSKLSFQENARKADAARKAQGPMSPSKRWSLIALGLAILVWLLRGLLRRR